MLLEGKTAVVTGIGPGMGRDISLNLAREGADIVMVGRSDRHMPGVAAEVEALGRRTWQVQADVAVADDCARVAQVVGDEVGALDILVNSAFHAGRIEPFEEANLDKWRRPLDINYFGTLQLTQALLPALKAAGADGGDARVIMVNTMSVQMIDEHQGSYVGSKAALAGVTKVLARELGRYGIRVNSVHPGYIWGDSVKIYFEMQAAERGEGVTWEDIYAERADETALKYLPHSSEISGAVVFFASPLAKCVTGAALPVNAGHWMAPSA
jgi:NAD(P)-dependent dehydrogenase (short-subunit alcohol dehydrogenase family)